MKVLVDAGILDFAAFVAALVFGTRTLAAAGEKLSLACVAMVLLHFIIDFDARFAAFMFVLP